MKFDRIKIKVAIFALLVVASERLVLDSFPDQRFWHFRELLEFPGFVVQGLMNAILSTDISDASERTIGVDRIFNFLWLYLAVFILGIIGIKLLHRKGSESRG